MIELRCACGRPFAKVDGSTLVIENHAGCELRIIRNGYPLGRNRGRVLAVESRHGGQHHTNRLDLTTLRAVTGIDALKIELQI